MGVIKKILFRGDILGKPRHRNMFLDMEENIHIHYRDLRIELSRGEFEDIAAIFATQSAELLKIIENKNYQDGKLPNANQDDVRIWTESRLKHDLKYHPRRFSLEDCGDGYHFHYRNYKLLIDKEEFRQIARLFASLDLDQPYAATYQEVIELLEANDVDFTLDAGNVPGRTLAILAAQHHLPKIRDIFNYIGFVSEDPGAGLKRYSNGELQVVVRADKERSASEYKRLRGLNSTERLVDYLAVRGPDIDAEDLNLIKAQVLNLIIGIKSGKIVNVETNPQTWLYAKGNGQIIFPYSSTRVTDGKKEADGLYRSWANVLAGFQQVFVKPPKDIQPADVQTALKAQVEQILRSEVASFIAVDKIYVMGSALRGEMGHYRVPFVHGNKAKLGSDIDILVEIDPTRESDVPAYWELHMPKASNHCAIYHIADVPMNGDVSAWQQRFPHLTFNQHLVDAYVYLPSTGFRDEIDAFLKKFSAQLFYERKRDGTVFRSDEEKTIAERLRHLYGFKQVAVERMKVSTENALFKVFTANDDLVLKLFKASGNYSRSRIEAHTDYEQELVTQLVERGIPTARVIPAKKAKDKLINGSPALLFERIPGLAQQKPEYPIDRVCAALAQIHGVQIDNPLNLTVDFQFDDSCMIWLPQFDQYLQMPDHDPEIALAFNRMAPIAAKCHPGENRTRWFSRSPQVHNHGDVTPKNVIYGETGPVRFFDFNNAFFGPRMADVIDGGFEYSLAEKYIHLADFSRFDTFLSSYQTCSKLRPEELEDLNDWIGLIGVIKFAKEVRVMLAHPKESLRRKRALAIAQFVSSRLEA